MVSFPAGIPARGRPPGPAPDQKVGVGLSVDLVISSVPATPHFSKILASSPLAISSLNASESALAIGEPLAVTNPAGVELIWPRNFVPAMWSGHQSSQWITTSGSPPRHHTP